MENNTTQHQSQPENINYTPAPQDPTPAQPLPRHLPKKLAIAGIVILLFLLLAGTAVGIYNLGKKSATPSPTPVAENSPSPTPNPTADWKTYEGNGFSFKYPASLKITKEKAYSFMTAQDVSTIKISDNDLNDPFSLKIFVENNPKNLSQQQLIDAYLKRIEGANDNFSSNRITKTLTNYNNGEISGLYALFGADYDYDVIIMTKNNMIYTFVYTGDQGEKIKSTDEELVKQILSTFKFTNSITSTTPSDWKTYTNVDYGISMEIPSNYEVLTQLPTKTVLGIKQTGDSIPIITLSKNYDTPYQSFPLCSKTSNTYPCKDKEIELTTIDKENVNLVKVINGGDSLYELISIPDPDNTKIKEIKMSVGGGGLQETFDHLKNTLKFN